MSSRYINVVVLFSNGSRETFKVKERIKSEIIRFMVNNCMRFNLTNKSLLIEERKNDSNVFGAFVVMWC